MNWKRRSRRGFTLTELLVVVSIVAILATTTIVSVTTLIPALRQKELDNSARELFLAAQNRLTMMQATGELDTLVGKGLEAKLDNAAEGDTDYGVTGVYLDKAGAESYILDASTLTGGEFSGDYLVEFNVEYAQVIAVYCCKEQLDSYDLVSLTYRNGTTNWREPDGNTVRKKQGKQIGYYDYRFNGGTAQSFNSGVPDGDNSGISVTVTPVNREELYLYVKVIVSKEGYSFSSVTVELNGQTLSADLLKKRGYENTAEGRILLDKNTSGYTFADLKTDITPGDTITATVTAVASKGSETITKQVTSSSFNTLYDNSTDATTTTAKIAYVRHLENLTATRNKKGYRVALQVKDINYAAAVSQWSIVSGAASFGAGTMSYTPVALKEVTYDGGNKKLINFTVSAKGDVGIFSKAVGTGHFNTGETEWLKNIQIVNPRIINTEEAKVAGTNTGALAGKTTSYSIQNCSVYLDSAYFISGNENYNDYDDFTVTGGQYVGGLVGTVINAGKGTNKNSKAIGITGCFASVWEVKGTEKEGLSTYVGGLFGMIHNQNELQMSYANTYCIKGTYAGGLIGVVSDYNNTDKNVKAYSFKNCYAVTETLQGSQSSAGFAAEECRKRINGFADTFTYANCYALIGSKNTSNSTGTNRYGFTPSGGNTANCFYYAVSGFNAKTGVGTPKTLAEITKYFSETASVKNNWSVSAKNDSHPYLTAKVKADSNYDYLWKDTDPKFSGILLKNMPHYGNWPDPAGETDADKGVIAVKIDGFWNDDFIDVLSGKFFLKYKVGETTKYEELKTEKSKDGNYKPQNTVTGECTVVYKEVNAGVTTELDIMKVTLPVEDADAAVPVVNFFTLASRVRVDNNQKWTGTEPTNTCLCKYTYESKTTEYYPADVNSYFNTIKTYVGEDGAKVFDHTYLMPKDADSVFTINDSAATYSGVAVTKNRGTRTETNNMTDKVELSYQYYTMTYNGNGGKIGSSSTLTQLYHGGETVTIISTIPTKSGNGFKYWTNGKKNYAPSGVIWPGEEMESSLVINDKTELTAVWYVGDRTIYFDKNCDDDVSDFSPTSKTVVGASVQLPQYALDDRVEHHFKRKNYNFIGWNTKPDGSGYYYAPLDVVYMGSLSEMTLYAQWTYGDTITIIYNGNGALTGTTPPTTFPRTLKTVRLSYNGYVHSYRAFGGWYYKEYGNIGNTKWKTYGVEPYTANTEELVDLVKDTDMPWLVTLYANWIENGTFTVKYQLEKMKKVDGMVAAYRGIAFVAYFEAEPGYNLPESVDEFRIYVDSNRDGVFAESERITLSGTNWNSKTGQLVIPSGFVKGSILIAAGATPGKHTITYHLSDTDETKLEIKESYGTFIAVKDPDDADMNWSIDGKIFTGWKDGDGKSYQPGDTFMVKGNMELTAQWKDGDINNTVGVFTYNYYRYNGPEVATSNLFNMSWFTWDSDVSTQYNYFVPNGQIQFQDTGTTKEQLTNSGQPYFVGVGSENKTFYYGVMLPEGAVLNNYTITLTLKNGENIDVIIDNKDTKTGKSYTDFTAAYNVVAKPVYDTQQAIKAKKAELADVKDQIKTVQFTDHAKWKALDDKKDQLQGELDSLEATLETQQAALDKNTLKAALKAAMSDPLILYKGKLVPDYATEHLLLKPSTSLAERWTLDHWDGLRPIWKQVEDTRLCTRVGVDALLAQAIGVYTDPDFQCSHMRRVQTEEGAYPTGYDYYFFSYTNRDGSSLNSEVISITVNKATTVGTKTVTKSNAFDIDNYERPYYAQGDVPGTTSTGTQVKLGYNGVAPMAIVTNGNVPVLSRSYANFFKAEGSQQDFTVLVNENDYRCTSVILTTEDGQVLPTRHALFSEEDVSIDLVYTKKYTFHKAAMNELAEGTYTVEFYFVTKNGGIALEDPVTFKLNVYNGAGYRYLLMRIEGLENNAPGGDGGYNERYVQLSGISLAADPYGVSTYQFTDAARIYDLQVGDGYLAAAEGEDAYLLIDNNDKTKFCEKVLFCSDASKYSYLLVDLGEGYQFSQNYYPYVSYTTAPDTSVFISRGSYWGSSAEHSLRAPTKMSFYASNTVFNSLSASSDANRAYLRKESNWTSLTGTLSVTSEANKNDLLLKIRQNMVYVGPFKNSDSLKYDLHYRNAANTEDWKTVENAYGDQVIPYEIPAKTSQIGETNYYFHGWATKVDATTAEYLPGDHFYLVRDTTLYPVFKDTEPEWTLIYNANLPDGTSLSSLKYLPENVYGYGAKNVSSMKPELSGYKFKGWTRQKPDEAAGAVVWGGDLIQPGASITLNQNIILYAVWEKTSGETEKLVYVEDYDTENIGTKYTVTAKAGDAALTAKLTTTTRLTYSLTGDSMKLTVTLPESTKLRTLSYVLNGVEKEVEPKKNDKNEATNDYEISLTGLSAETTVYIKVRVKDEIKIIYYPNYDEENPAECDSGETLHSFSIKESEIATYTVWNGKIKDTNTAAYQKMTKLGMSFKEWNTEPDGTGMNAQQAIAAYKGNGELKLYAQWRWKVTYNLNISSISNKTVKLTNLAKDLDSGLFVSKTLTDSLYTKTNSEDSGMVIYTYAKNNGSVECVLLGVEENTEAAQKYILDGWYTAATGGTQHQLIDITGNLTVYARYEIGYRLTFTVTQDTKGYFVDGSGAAVKTQQTVRYLKDGSYFSTLPEPMSVDQNRYRFQNWKYENGEDISESARFDHTKGTVFTDVWKTYYKVTYKYNDKETYRYLTYGESYYCVTLDDVGSYKFYGWTLKNLSSAVNLSSPNGVAKVSIFTESNDVTVYATWRKQLEKRWIRKTSSDISELSSKYFVIVSPTSSTTVFYALRATKPGDLDVTVQEYTISTMVVDGVTVTYLNAFKDATAFIVKGKNLSCLASKNSGDDRKSENISYLGTLDVVYSIDGADSTIRIQYSGTSGLYNVYVDKGTKYYPYRGLYFNGEKWRWGDGTSNSYERSVWLFVEKEVYEFTNQPKGATS